MTTLTLLPNSVNALQELVLANQAAHQKREKGLREQIALLQEQVNLLRAGMFGKKSEGLSLELLGQQGLFPLELEQPDPAPPKATKVEEHTRKRPVRKSLPKDIPRREEIHDLDDSEKVCTCGEDLTCIGETASEKLEIIPETRRVVRHIVPKYTCKRCNGVENEGAVIKSASMPPQLLPKTMATASLLAFIIVSKYTDSLPLYRLEQRFSRYNIDLSRKTMTDWVLKLGHRCSALTRLLLEDVRGAPWLGMDETRMRVIDKKKKRGKCRTAWIWVIRSTLPKPIVLFHYHASRYAAYPKDALTDYVGTVISDGWQAYDFLDGEKDGTPWSKIIHAGCWVHVRRYFDRVIKATKPKSLAGTLTGRCLTAIKRLYTLERQADQEDFTIEQRMDMRNRDSKPIVEAMRKDLDEAVQSSTPVGALKEAIGYTLRHWSKLTVFLDQPIPLDNNLTEGAIRPFVVGRKNWMFAGSVKGAEANAAFYSLVESAKANGWNVYDYFVRLFEALPLAQTDDELRALLPHELAQD